MPGYRCIVPRCISGYYDSCVIKYNYFTISKDPVRFEQWTKTIPRKDFEIKPNQVSQESYQWKFYLSI